MSSAPRNRIDISQKRFGMLVAIEPHHVYRNAVYWRCECDCGGETVVAISHLTKGATISCGCQETKNRNAIKERAALNCFDGTNIAKIKSSKARADSFTGIRGVSWSARDKVWHARIQLRGKRIHLGSFKTIAEAAAARAQAELDYYAPIIAEHEKTKSEKASE